EPGCHAAAAERERRMPAAAADKSDERRSIDRPRHQAARNPDPTTIKIGPAAVMKWRESPRRVIHPGPAPRLSPDPMAIAIRRPIRRDPVWEPDRTIFRNYAPDAVFIQVFIANHLARDIARGGRFILALVTRQAPVIPVVGRVDVSDVIHQRINSGDSRSLTRVDRKGGVAGRHFRFADSIGDGGIALRIHVDTIKPRTQ